MTGSEQRSECNPYKAFLIQAAGVGVTLLSSFCVAFKQGVEGCMCKGHTVGMGKHQVPWVLLPSEEMEMSKIN